MFLVIGVGENVRVFAKHRTELQIRLYADVAKRTGTYHFPIGATTIAQNCLGITTEKLRREKLPFAND